MTELYRVGNLTFGNAVKQIAEIFDIEDNHIILDFSRLTKVRSAGMTHFVAGIESLNELGKIFYIIEDAAYWDDPSQGLSYAANMGLFDALRFTAPIGRKVGELHGNDKYLPLHKITWDNLFETAPDYHEGIETLAQNMAHILSSSSNILKELEDTLQYMLREMIRNTFEHAGDNIEHIWIAAQNHPTEGTTEIGIADSGVGILQSLTINPELRKIVTDDKSALLYAVKPGISGKKYKKEDDEWSNSGFGLYVTSNIFNEMGDFEVVSGSARLIYQNNSKTTEPVNFKGTSYTAIIDHNKIQSMRDNMVSYYVSKGEEEAKLDIQAIKTASKSSKLLHVKNS